MLLLLLSLDRVASETNRTVKIRLQRTFTGVYVYLWPLTQSLTHPPSLSLAHILTIRTSERADCTPSSLPSPPDLLPLHPFTDLLTRHPPSHHYHYTLTLRTSEHVVCTPSSLPFPHSLTHLPSHSPTYSPLEHRSTPSAHRHREDCRGSLLRRSRKGSTSYSYSPSPSAYHNHNNPTLTTLTLP